MILNNIKMNFKIVIFQVKYLYLNSLNFNTINDNQIEKFSKILFYIVKQIHFILE